MTSAPASALQIHTSIASHAESAERPVIVYLPPGYDDSQDHYPVLYLQDGQNLFDPSTAFANQAWGLGAVLDSLINEGLIEPLIVAGIYNRGENRIAEYTHIQNRQGIGGQARRYAKYVSNEVKPFIDAMYRTKTDADNTGIGGSSLGGLVSFYMGLHYPDQFGKLIIMSPSIWWANRAILREARRLRGKTAQKLWLDVGTAEGDNAGAFVQDARDLRDALLKRGWILGQDLRYVEDEGAGHNEKAWGCRVRDALVFQFPSPGNPQSSSVNAQSELHC